MGEVKEGCSGRHAWLEGGESWARLHVAVGRAAHVRDGVGRKGLEWDGVGRSEIIWEGGLEDMGLKGGDGRG